MPTLAGIDEGAMVPIFAGRPIQLFARDATGHRAILMDAVGVGVVLIRAVNDMLALHAEAHVVGAGIPVVAIRIDGTAWRYGNTGETISVEAKIG